MAHVWSVESCARGRGGVCLAQGEVRRRLQSKRWCKVIRARRKATRWHTVPDVRGAPSCFPSHGSTRSRNRAWCPRSDSARASDILCASRQRAHSKSVTHIPSNAHPVQSISLRRALGASMHPPSAGAPAKSTGYHRAQRPQSWSRKRSTCLCPWLARTRTCPPSRSPTRGKSIAALRPARERHAWDGVPA